MGRPTSSKNGGGNGSTATRNGGLRATKSVKSSANGKNGTAAGQSHLKTDRSQLNFPYDIRIGDFTSLYNAVSKGTPKIKRILTEECDYIMECRVCRNLFRSLPNFVTHKQSYCKKAYDSTWALGLSNLIQTSDNTFNVQYEVDPELLFDDKGDQSCSRGDITDKSEDSVNKISNTVTEIDMYNNLAKRLSASKLSPGLITETCTSPSASASAQSASKESDSIRLQIKPLVDGPCGSVVVQQRIICDPSNCDIVSAHMNPVEIIQRDTAILGPDGKVMCTGTSKGIEQVVSRLSARMQAMEDLKSQKMCSSFSCEICKTVFDSDKALRQHKREGLECGRAWDVKSSSGVGKVGLCRTSPEIPVVPGKRPKLPEKTENLQTSKSRELSNAPSVPVRFTKYFSPTSHKGESRSPSHKKILQSTVKTKRAFALSPVKNIMKKYSKLDSGNTNVTDGTRKDGLACNRCLSNFPTKHEMSMHLAMCTGVINYANLRNNEPKEERIGITVRHNFANLDPKESSMSCKMGMHSSVAPISATKNIVNVSNESQQVCPIPNPTVGNVPSSISSLNGSTPEVNNNRLLITKISYSPQSPDITEPSGMNELDGLLTTASRNPDEDEVESDGRGGDISSSDSGVSSGSVVSLPAEHTAEVKPCVTTTASKAKSISTTGTTGSSKSRKSKPTKMIILGPVSTRLETSVPRSTKAATQKAFNLRKSIQSRIRKSRRILRPAVPLK